MRLKSALFALPLSLLLLAPHASFADELTLTGTNGGSVDGVDIFPYIFTITGPGGTSTDISMSCLNFNREVTITESWAATPVAVSTIGSKGLDGESQQDYIEDAFLYNMYAGASAQKTSEIQFAIWDIMDPNDPTLEGDSGLDPAALLLVTAAQNAYASGNFGFDANDVVFVPTAGDPGNSQPQIFMVDPAPPAITPEPSSLLLFGTGLLGTVGMMRRRFMKTQTNA